MLNIFLILLILLLSLKLFDFERIHTPELINQF